MKKIVEGLVTAAGNTYYSPAVALGANNSAMYEGWQTAGAGTVEITMEGSNDLQNWTPAVGGAGFTLNGAPKWDQQANTSVISYAHLRLKLVGGGGAAAMVDAAIRTFHT